MTKIQTTSVWGVVKGTDLTSREEIEERVAETRQMEQTGLIQTREDTSSPSVYGQRQSPDTGGPAQNEEDPRSYGSARATTISRNEASVNRSDIPVGQPPAKVSAVPGKSGSSEVFRTQTGQVLDQTDDQERAGEITLKSRFTSRQLLPYEKNDSNVYQCIKCGTKTDCDDLLLGYGYKHAKPVGVTSLTKEGFSTKFYSTEFDLHCPHCNSKSFVRIFANAEK